MTRPIKFRAWVTQSDESFMAIQGEQDLETLQSFMFHYGDQYHLMQFTGCYDMHGREVFEGDILAVTAKDGSRSLHRVVFDGDYSPAFDMRPPLGHGVMNSFSALRFRGYAAAEVVGNVHENPEPLNQITGNVGHENS